MDEKFDDMDSYAAALGYDAIRAEGHGVSCSYTVSVKYLRDCTNIY